MLLIADGRRRGLEADSAQVVDDAVNNLDALAVVFVAVAQHRHHIAAGGRGRDAEVAFGTGGDGDVLVVEHHCRSGHRGSATGVNHHALHTGVLGEHRQACKERK